MVTTHADSALADVKAVLDNRVEAVRAKDIDRLMWLITHEHISFPIDPENWSAIVDTTP
jgi:ketosteroid isomerase-like protein